MVWLNALAHHLQPQVIQAREGAQIRAIKGSIGHVEVFQMDGVGTPIIGRPRPLPGHDTPNPAYHPHTLNYEEPLYLKNFRYRSFLLEGDVWCTEQGLGGFLGAFDASDLDEPFGRVVEEPG